MSVIVYLFVLLIAAGSVLFGLDWGSAPMSPMPASKYELHAAKPPPPPPSATAEATPAPEPAVSQPPAPAVAEPPPVSIIAAEPPAAAAPTCDVDACARAYRSFTANDCTYQPNDGPRRLCTKGTPPAAAASTASSATAPAARAQAACNVAACSQAYISFSATDCTYRPREGPRKLCEK